MTHPILQAALVSGTVASIVSSATLALLARTEKKSALQPVNATSHWLRGAEAANRTTADSAHTLVGYATHHASAVFWALPFHAWLAGRPKRSSSMLLRDAAVMSGIAAVVDYGVVPKRLTPGWELVLSKPSLIAAYCAMGIGLFAGARVVEALFERRDRR
jgi:hypothetical protein